MRLCLALSIFIVLLSCNNSSNYLNGELHEIALLKGPIKSVVEKSYLAKANGEAILRKRQPNTYEDDYVLNITPNGREFVYDFYNDGGSRKSTDKYRVNEFGLKEWFDNAGIEHTYTYDEFGRIKEERGSKMRIAHFYDGPNLVKQIYFVNNIEQGRLTYLTDTINDLFIELDISGKDTIGIRLFKEDAIGNLLFEELVEAEGVTETTEITYASDGTRATEKWTLFGNNQQQGWIDTKFDKGLAVEIIEFNADSSIVSVEKISYEFDQYGNWVTKIVNIDDTDYYLIEREIKYY